MGNSIPIPIIPQLNNTITFLSPEAVGLSFMVMVVLLFQSNVVNKLMGALRTFVFISHLNTSILT